MNKTRKKLSYTLSILSSFLLAQKVRAFSIMDETSPGCLSEGSCQVNDFTALAVAATKFFLGLSGSFALLFFVYGGVMFLISGGNPERVSKGKQILIGSVLGIIIVFASYTIIGFVLTAFEVEGGANWFTTTPLNKK